VVNQTNCDETSGYSRQGAELAVIVREGARCQRSPAGGTPRGSSARDADASLVAPVRILLRERMALPIR